MKVLFFSDIHNDWKALEKLLAIEADYYFCAGDLVSWARGLDRAGEIMKAKAERMMVIPGNHESAEDIAIFCHKWGFEAMHGRQRQIDGRTLAALGYSNTTPFNTPGEYTEEELRSKLAQFAAPTTPQILVCHCPPKGTPLDKSGQGDHFGSLAVAECIQHLKPEWFFCGHIHEAEGVRSALGVEGMTTGVNVGKKGLLLDLQTLKAT